MSNSTQAMHTSVEGGHEASHKVRNEASVKGVNPLRSDGAIGKHFNPEGAVGQIGQKVGGPFASDGAIGTQFDASKHGIAGSVEEMTGGPRQMNNEPDSERK